MTGDDRPVWPASGWHGGSVAPVEAGGDAPIVDPGFHAPESERYERAGEIGRGGMGKVTAAFDRRLGRQVALKDVVPGVQGADARRRLMREARITARLDHPGIVPVHDAGVGPDGEPFYAMRVVRGRSFSEVLAESTDRASRLAQLRHFLAACEAIAYAHSLNVVHRDLKPGNIRVGAFGETQVIDWGLARALDEVDDAADAGSGPQDASLTRVGAVIGTPAYMSPEAARGESADKRSDVWSLGAVLHEILVGETPFGRRGTDTTLEAVSTEEARSVRVRAPDAPADLAAIVDRALQRDPDRRYADADALAKDVERWLDGGRVEAHAYSTWELARRVISAWRAPIVVGSVGFVLLSIGGWLAVDKVLSERDRAVRAEQEARGALAASDRTLAQSLLTSGQAASDRRARAEAELLAAHSLALVDTPQARGLLALYGAEPRPSGARSFHVPCDVIDASTDGRWALCADGRSVSRWEAGATAPTWTVAATVERAEVVDGADLVAVQSGDAQPDRLLDAATGTVRAQVMGAGYDSGLRLSSDARWAANHGLVDWQVWSTETGQIQLRLPSTDRAAGKQITLDGPDGRIAWVDVGTHLLWSDTPDGERHGLDLGRYVSEVMNIDWASGHTLLVMSPRAEVVAVDVSTGEELWRTSPDVGSGRRARASATSPMALVEGGSGAALIDTRTGVVVDRVPLRSGAYARLAKDGTVVVVDHGVRVLPWPESNGWLGMRAREGLSAVAVSEDGSRVAAAGGAGVSSLFTGDGALIGEFPPLTGVMKGVAFVNHGADVLFASGTLEEGARGRAMAAGDGTGQTEVGVPVGGIRRMGALGPDLLWAAAYDQWVSVYRRDAVAGWVERRVPTPMMSEGQSAQRGDVALLVAWDGGVWTLRRDASAEPVAARWLQAASIVSVAVDATGALRAVAVEDRIDLYVGDATVPVRSLSVEGRVVVDMALSNDGRWLAVGGADGALRVWSTADGALRLDARGHDGRIGGVSFNQDGTLVYTASWDHTVRRWDLRVLDAEPATLRAEREAAWQVGLDALVSR